MVQQMQQKIHSAFSAFGLTGKSPRTSIWYLDSGASNHMTNSPNYLTHAKQYDGPLKIHTAHGASLPITNVGNIPHLLPLHDVLYSPHLDINLLSIG